MKLTDLQQDERDAMCGDRAAILRVVGGLRQYRALVEKLLSMHDFSSTCRVWVNLEDIEGETHEEAV
jgi:hypothetical protein